MNAVLKEGNVVEAPPWRLIQHLADVRNLYDHNKKAEPSESRVDDLLDGVAKVFKTLF